MFSSWFPPSNGFASTLGLELAMRKDKATGEVLTEKNKKFELKKIFQLPWMFWCILAFSLFQTSAALVFSQNATELAEKRFNVDSIKAGWYSALSQYSGK
ncbi:unnamed protein product [Aspergillus oryzae var. brunneus]|uniref:Unnamed protein product n=1 Tax=Aspergillus oryzae var. brunneus TaxID=332754 RepID=A0ABQ6KPS6_ASPOZ|nr:unnamed protein product [Aspergillus oryzae var. brunneus]